MSWSVTLTQHQLDAIRELTARYPDHGEIDILEHHDHGVQVTLWAQPEIVDNVEVDVPIAARVTISPGGTIRNLASSAA